MKKTLLATTALAFAGATAAAPASAADMLNVGVGGYMQQWFGYVDRDDNTKDKKRKSLSEGGADTQADTEIYFQGSLESDMGLKYTVHVELEGNRSKGGDSTLDESFVRVTGEFGDLEFGSRDHSMVRLHSAISDVGIGLSAGDTQKWIPGAYLDTAGHGGVAGGGDALKLSYISPRVSGLQLGVSYAPDSDNKDGPTTPPNGNDEASWGVGLNFQQAVGDASVTFSLGHRSRSTADTEIAFMTGATTDADGTALSPVTVRYLNILEDTIEDRPDDLTDAAAGLSSDEIADILDAQARIDEARDGMMMKGDDATLTNAGMAVSFGAFGFNVAYATSDGGAYTTAAANVGLTQADVAALNAAVEGGNPYSFDDGKVIDSRHTWDHDSDSDTALVPEDATNNNPDNDFWAAKKVVEDKSKNFDVWGVSVSYTDGPVALSLGHMVHEEDEGGEREATMLSASYTLAPGVAWRSSIFTAEDTTSHKDVKGGVNEGTGFVTGITLNF